jgi:hypothetical protein
MQGRATGGVAVRLHPPRHRPHQRARKLSFLKQKEQKDSSQLLLPLPAPLLLAPHRSVLPTNQRPMRELAWGYECDCYCGCYCGTKTGAATMTHFSKLLMQQASHQRDQLQLHQQQQQQQ